MGAEENYVRGYLLRKGPPWHVRVTDPTSPHRLSVIQIASFRGGDDWAVKGLNVRFFIGCRDGKPDIFGHKQQVPYALDVHPIPCPPSQKK